MKGTKPSAMTWSFSCLLLVTILVGPDLRAQEPPMMEGPEMAVPGEPGEVDLQQQREQIRERLRILRAWRLTEVIEMDEATGVQLFNLLDGYDEQLEELQTRMEERASQLRSYLEQGTGSEQEVSTLVDEIMTLHLQIEQARVTLVQDSAAFLNARQRAALMLFLPRFDQEVQQMFREVRRARRGARALPEEEAGDRMPPRQRRGAMPTQMP